MKHGRSFSSGHLEVVFTYFVSSGGSSLSQIQLSDVWQPDPAGRSRFARFKGMVHLSLKQLRHRFLESLLILLGIALGVGVLTGAETFVRYLLTLESSYLTENMPSVYVRPKTADLSGLYASQGGVPAVRIAESLTEPVELYLEHMLQARQDVPSVAYAGMEADRSLSGEIVAVNGKSIVPDEPELPADDDGFGGSGGGVVMGGGVAMTASSETDAFADMPPYLMLQGVTPDGLAMQKRDMLAGRWMTWDEYNEGSPVLILEEADISKIFPELEPEEAIGQTVTMGTHTKEGPLDMTWQVIGVVRQRERYGSSPGGWIDGYGPHTAGHDGQVRAMELNFAPADPNDMAELIADLEVYFASLLGEGRVEVTNPTESLAEQRPTTRNLSLALMGLAGLTLFVAAINMLNLFTARVIRRRRTSAMTVALGAERRSLFNRIVTEAVLLGVGGSILGLGVARGVVFLFKDLYGEISLSFVDVGFGLLAGVIFSVLFGLYPAYLSSSLNPADGLR